MIRAAFLRRMAFAALATALFEVRVPEVDASGWEDARDWCPLCSNNGWYDPNTRLGSGGWLPMAPCTCGRTDAYEIWYEIAPAELYVVDLDGTRRIW